MGSERQPEGFRVAAHVELHPLGSHSLDPTGGLGVERVTRIELASSAWEAGVLPLNYTRR